MYALHGMGRVHNMIEVYMGMGYAMGRVHNTMEVYMGIDKRLGHLCISGIHTMPSLGDLTINILYE